MGGRINDLGFKVFDLKDPDNSDWLSKFSELINSIQNSYSKDRLISNYQNLDYTLNHYEMFNIITKDHKILGFSGMHQKPYPPGVSRVLSRLFYGDELRKKTLKGHQLPSYASQLMLPVQVKLAQTMNKDIIFLSFEDVKRRSFCYKLAESLSKKFGQNWEVHDQMVNTVRRLPNGELNYEKPTWQNVVLLKLKEEATLPLPTMNVDEWKRRYVD